MLRSLNNRYFQAFCMALYLGLHLGAISVSSAQTQFELNDQMGRDLQDAETAMAATLTSIQRLYAEDAQFLHCLAESQRAWEVYRDRQLAMIFPYKDDPKEGYGTVFPMCWAIWKARLTMQRITELKQWVDGIEEGDVCLGSIRVK
jgi:uncharacterized protein YecT (DUF1311 family)